jgi:ribosomal protein S18 acetylase RimI-like enzyme
MTIQIRLLEARDREWVARFLAGQWGSAQIVTRGRVHSADSLPGFIAWQDGSRLGLVLYNVDGNECEIISLNTIKESIGIGSVLLNAVKEQAMAAQCRRLWLITTNDNLHALRFYQKRGWRLIAVYPNALEQSRRLKPEIPLVGLDGIPLRDEIELEMPLE